MSRSSAIRTLRAEARRGRSTDAERLAAYVAGYVQRHGSKTRPTVRQAARGLRWRQIRVKRAADDVAYGGRLAFFSFSVVEVPFGDWFVDHLELMDPADARLLRTGGMP